jgi:CHAD domain-containing protein
MATVTAITGNGGARPEQRGLDYWMERVLKELEGFRRSPNSDTVHDFRVAVRRCRSVAGVMEEVDPDTAWKEVQKIPRKLFHALGALRDTHVMEEWVKTLGHKNDAIRTKLEPVFEKEETELREEALKSAAKFDVKAWKKLEQTLRRRAQLVKPGTPAAQCIVLERYEEANERHALAMRGEEAAPWHKLRIGLKRFRYTTEILLPERSAAWGENLKRLQDLLGDIHDLNVLEELVEKAAGAEETDSREIWEKLLEKERRERMETYRRLTLGKTSLWREWRRGLPRGKQLEEAALARLRATARAMETRPSRATQVARIARRLFDSVARSKTGAVFGEPGMRRLFTAAARLHGATVPQDEGSSRKEARKFLKKATLPPGWTEQEWEVVVETIRYHRGEEPRAKDKAFAKLTTSQQEKVRGLAGVLRLARALRKCGVEGCVGLRVEKSADALIVKAPNLGDSEDIAVRLAAGKHLLERQLDRPLIVKSELKQGILLTLPEKKEEEQVAGSLASA